MALRVDTDFPCGNACAIEMASNGDRDVVRFAADPHGGTEALWFFFRVRGCKGRPVELVLTNCDSCLGSGANWGSVRPVLRQSGGDWQRVARADLRTLDDGRHEPAWTVSPSGSSFEFAFCYPYGPDDLRLTLEACGAYWRQDTIGVTSKGRALTRVSNSRGEDKGDTPGVYVVARQHSGETPGSWVLDGLLRRAAENVDPRALVIWAIPFANFDGVLDGDYGKDPFPHDLNRAWTRPPMRHEVHVLQRDMARWAARCRPALAADLHAPGATEAGGAYFHLPRACQAPAHVRAVRAATEAVLGHLPAELAKDEPPRQAAYASRWDATGIMGAYVWATYAIPSLTMETPYAATREIVFTCEEYRRLGASLLDGVLACPRQ